MEDFCDSQSVVLEVWETMFPDQIVGGHSNFFDLGGDSLAAIKMSIEVGGRMGVGIPVGSVYRAPTVSLFSSLIASLEKDLKEPIVTPLQRYGTKRPLFAIAPAIGGIFHYRDFAEVIGEDQPCYCVESQVSSSGEHNYDSVEEIAQYCNRAVRRIQADGPFRLCGYSFGGTIAWEMAKQLKEDGHLVEIVILYDSIMQGKDSFMALNNGKLVGRILREIRYLRYNLNTFRRHGASINWSNLFTLGRNKVVELAKGFLVVRSKKNGEEIDDNFDAIENSVQKDLRSRYDYGTYPDEVFLLRARKQLVLRRVMNYELGWTDRAEGGLHIIDVPGDHVSLMRRPFIEELAMQTRGLLNIVEKKVLAGSGIRVESIAYPESSLSTVLDRFAEIVEKFGERPAILDDGEFITFRKLDALSNNIAAAIVEQNIPNLEGVAVYLRNGYWMVAAFLGVLKAGKYYVAIDPEHPADRTHRIVDSCKAGLLISDRDYMPQVKEAFAGLSLEYLSLDSIDFERSVAPPAIDISPESIAVILYTSGSTGSPKGVIHSHKSVASVGWRRGKGISLSPNDRYLAVYSGAFMGCMNGIYASLSYGSCLCFYSIPNQGVDALAPWIIANKISIFHAVTSVYRRFLGTLYEGISFPDLRVVVPGGEPSRHSDIDKFKAYFSPRVTYYANLGSSECGSIAFEPIRHETKVSKNIPVGVPFASLNLQILDEDEKVCAIEEVGEICLRSENIFWGYLESEKGGVLSDCLGASLREGIYRSGDYGYLTREGKLINLGRRDGQVKVNGYRIEISDVESAILRVEGIKDVVVVPRNDGGEDANIWLCAFYQTSLESTITESMIRARLMELLPRPMIPFRFIRIDNFPTLPNGKVNRLLLADNPLEEIEDLCCGVLLVEADQSEDFCATLP